MCPDVLVLRLADCAAHRLDDVDLRGTRVDERHPVESGYVYILLPDTARSSTDHARRRRVDLGAAGGRAALQRTSRPRRALTTMRHSGAAVLASMR